ncbi:melanocortin receptor 5-like [Mya arenaria]|uniref:melanocortin receptor 5-like n=1 Tax=Mya arenaria TaxID=6604 RepID=UPI0022E53B71|nr:melanocortin receptor 5-like [Mya arenaria]
MSSTLTPQLKNGLEFLDDTLPSFNSSGAIHLPLDGSISGVNFPPLPKFDVNILQSIQFSNESNTANGNYTFDIEALLRQLNSSDLDLDVLRNLTGEFPLWPSLQPYSPREKAERLLQQPEYIVILLLCLVALVTNIVSIVATCHIRGSLTMHLKLIINLAASDILIVFSILILIINKIFNTPPEVGSKPEDRLLNACFFASVNSVNIMSYLIALLNLFAMALDHYIAIMMPLRYKHLMSKKRGYVFISLLWIIATIGGFSNFFIGFIGYERHELFNFCEYIMDDSYHGEMLIFGVTIVCLFAIVVIYTRIFFEVKKIQALAMLVPNYSLHNNKAMITTLVIIGAFTICWLPNCIFQITMIAQIQFNKKIVYKLFSKLLLISKYLHILQLANCTADPIIYAVRLKVVQTGYRNFLAHIWGSYKSMKSNIHRRNSIKSFKAGYRPSFFKQGCDIELCDIDTDKKMSINHESDTPNPDSQFSSGPFFKLSDESDVNDNDLVTKVLIHHFSSENLANGYEETVL